MLLPRFWSGESAHGAVSSQMKTDPSAEEEFKYVDPGSDAQELEIFFLSIKRRSPDFNHHSSVATGTGRTDRYCKGSISLDKSLAATLEESGAGSLL